MRTVIVFGTFDGIHEGHKAMLKQARAHGDFLTVVVARDHIVQQLKGHSPKFNLMKRMEELSAQDGVDRVLVGDKELGVWEIVRKERPDVIAIGYDQTILGAALEKNLDRLGYVPEIVHLKSFEPHIYKSSLLNK